MSNSIPYTDDYLTGILSHTKTIAVVGLDSSPERTSYKVAKVLQEHGYTIIPVNPVETEVLGQKAYPNLAAIPVPVDMVDIFRRTEFIPAHVDEAIAIGAKTVWMQLDLLHEEAATKAETAGLAVVMDRCAECEVRRLTEAGRLP
jgi:predicted CoA-binding protein